MAAVILAAPLAKTVRASAQAAVVLAGVAEMMKTVELLLMRSPAEQRATTSVKTSRPAMVLTVHKLVAYWFVGHGQGSDRQTG
jgi:hypothetical protein